MRKNDGNLITDKDKIANKFKNMFEELLNKLENITTVEVNEL